MKRPLILSLLSLALLASSSCRRRRAEPTPVPVTAEPAAQAPAPGPAPEVPGAVPTPAPSVAGDATVEAKRFQSRAERNDTWIGKLAGNDPVAKTRAMAEIQAAKLPPAEMAELRKQAATYGVTIP
jgi:hypothetical protein